MSGMRMEAARLQITPDDGIKVSGNTQQRRSTREGRFCDRWTDPWKPVFHSLAV